MAARRSAAARTDFKERRQGVPADGAPVQRPIPKPATVTKAANLDRLVHDRTRLAIVSALAVNPTLSFNELKAMTETTDGNLSVHARKLEDAGYVTCTKGFEGRVPRTEFTLTDAGRRALQKYLDHMEAIIKHARAKTR
jgi:DNA-binding MarR family transcriptional regulator